MALTRKDIRFLANHRLMIGWALAATVSAAPAFASTSQKTAPSDVYPATESETPLVSTPPIATPPVAPAHAVVRSSLKQAAGIAVPRPTAPSRLKATPSDASSYDLVPSDQVDPLGKRLQLVELLIRKYSRAYDYRAHTVGELNEILVKLDAASAPKTASAARPAPSVSKAAPAQLPTPSEDDEVNGGENPHAIEE